MERTIISKKDVLSNSFGQYMSPAVVDELAGELDEKQQRRIEAFTPDTYTTRLLKYIPAEVIALYLTLDAILRSSENDPVFVHWLIFAFGLFGTYLYLWRVARVYKQTQLLLSCGAYCIWVFALGGPFINLQWYDPLYAGLLLPSYTFIIAIIEA